MQHVQSFFPDLFLSLQPLDLVCPFFAPLHHWIWNLNPLPSPALADIIYCTVDCLILQVLLSCDPTCPACLLWLATYASLAILSTWLSSRAPCTKTSCPSLFAAAKSCNTEFLRFFLGFTVYSVNDIRQGREICTTHASVPSLHTVHPAPVTQGWTEFFFPHLAEVIEGTLRFTVHIS